MADARPPPILVATLPDVRPLAAILKCLSFRSQATLKMGHDGLRFTVEEGRGLQAHAYISAPSFSTYAFSLSPTDPAALSHSPSSPSSSPTPGLDADAEGQGDQPFCQTSVSLATLLECLNIFGNAGSSGAGAGNPFKREREGTGFGDDEAGSEFGGRRKRQGGGREEEDADAGREKTSLRLSYQALGEPVVLLLEESGIVTRCELTTYEPEGLLDLAFPDDDRVVRLIMKSEWLRDALAELPASSDKLSISFAPPSAGGSASDRSQYKRRRVDDGFGEQEEEEEEEERAPLFRLESTGTMGSTEMDYSDDHAVLEVFECDAPCRNTYKFSHVQLTKNALNASIKTSIRTSPPGLASFQFMIPLSPRGAAASVNQGKVGFVEFLVVALDEDY
ncbi:hypothetical protein JCM10207_002140 [Rhodosporidiobolus poonsookiae]